MSDNSSHPSKEELNAYSLGQLPEAAAVAIDSHISECQTCCETVVGLNSNDTFAELLLESAPSQAAPSLEHAAVGLSRSPDQNLPDVLAEHPRYEILGLIGRGGMGDVYKARHRRMDRTVALKVINGQVVRRQEAIDRFHREVKTAAQLTHPNIVTSHDADQAGEFHFLAMEYVDGVDLAQTIKQRGALPIAQACEYIRQAAMGLSYAHQRGMVHRDIKPHNLIVTEDGTVKILDFGLASLAPVAVPEDDMEDSQSDLTVAGAIMGTPDFISPEQASDARQADTRSDIYSLGATLYFLLSGRVPFDGGSVMHKLKSHAELDPESLSLMRSEIPEELVDVVSRMMAKAPSERFQSGEEVAAALSEFVMQSSLDEPPKPRRNSFQVWTGSIILFAAAAAALCMFLLRQHDPIADYEQMSQFMQSGVSQEPVGDVMARLLRTDDGRKLLRKLDAEYPKLAYTSGDFARGYTAVAILAYENRVTGVLEPELMLKGWSPTTTGMATRNTVRAFELASIRFDNAGDATCKAIMRYKTPEDPKLTLGLQPNSLYQAEIRLNDFIEGKQSLVDLLASGDFQSDFSGLAAADAAKGAPKEAEEITGTGRQLRDLPSDAPELFIDLYWKSMEEISDEPILTLDPENIAFSGQGSRRLGPDQPVQYMVSIALTDETWALLRAEIEELDEDTPWTHIVLVLNGEAGSEVDIDFDDTSGLRLFSPYYRTWMEAMRIDTALSRSRSAKQSSNFRRQVDGYQDFQGYWQLKSQIVDGVALDHAPEEDSNKVLFEGLRVDLAFESEGQENKGLFKLGTAGNLKTIDIRRENGLLTRGLYEIQGDILKLCFSTREDGKRPSALESSNESGTTLTTLKRINPPAISSEFEVRGKWKVTRGVVNGDLLPMDNPSYLTFTQDSVRIDFNLDVAKLDFQFVDKTATPMAINLVDAKGETLLGICEYDNENQTLQLCVRNVSGLDRPTDFSSRGEPKTTFVMLERVPAISDFSRIQGKWQLQSASRSASFLADWEPGSAFWTFGATKVLRLYGKEQSSVDFWLEHTERKLFLLEENWKLTQGSYEFENESLRIRFSSDGAEQVDSQTDSTELVLSRIADAKEE